MSEFTMTIGGESQPGENTIGVINPANETVFADAPDCSQGQLDAAMESAAQAYPGWSRDEARRRQVLNDCAEAIKSRVEELARILTQEQGKPLMKASEEVIGAAIWFQSTAALEIPLEVVQDTGVSRIEIRRRPLGVVGAITPWNFPLLLGVWKIAPALLAGNTVVIKPSPFTPLSTLKLGEILREVVPPGVLNVVSGGDELGSWVTHHPLVRKISFTGSIETGKKVAAAAAPDLKRVTLELGGNDAAIVLDDADPKVVAEKIFWGAFENCGQICSAIKRVYAHEKVYPSLLNEMAAMARKAKVGNGMDPDTQIGPLNNRPQFERVVDLVDEVKRSGARIVTGGAAMKGPGYFFPPTLVSDVDDDTRLVAEEQFGPALPVLCYKEVDEAVERANRTHYGLSGSVWSSDTDRAVEVAGRLECGTAWVNQHLAILPNLPFGGAKWSGIGVENGYWGLLGFTEIQVLNISRG